MIIRKSDLVNDGANRGSNHTKKVRLVKVNEPHTPAAKQAHRVSAAQPPEDGSQALVQ